MKSSNIRRRRLLLILAFTILGMATMGYHPGIEDDAVYLAAIKSDLDPALYPHNAAFFRLQLQATVFDEWIAGFVRYTHIPLAATELFFQFLSILLMLLGCWSIAHVLFEDERVQWAGVALTSAMLTLPVAGTALYLADQHLHPRNTATALVLLAVSRILTGRRWQAVPLLLLSFALHPIMAALGVSFCFFLAITTIEPVPFWLRSLRDSLAAIAPLGWIFESPSPAWHRALTTRSYYFLSKWTWYEWLGAVGPLFLFWLLWRISVKRGQSMLARFAQAVFAYGLFQQVMAMIVLGSPTLVRLTPMQPMRYLHLIYFFLTLLGGCLLGKYLLKTSLLRWAIFLIVINATMFASQRSLFWNSNHLELPGRESSNPWLQSFAWIRQNTPVDAYFAMDPNYLAASGEDYHSFRALAERSQLADSIKDTAVVTQVPELSQVWAHQVDAVSGWRYFRLADFERLKTQFGVNWVIVPYPQPPGLQCSWHNRSLSVCRIP